MVVQLNCVATDEVYLATLGSNIILDSLSSSVVCADPDLFRRKYHIGSCAGNAEKVRNVVPDSRRPRSSCIVGGFSVDILKVCSPSVEKDHHPKRGAGAVACPSV